MLILEEFDPKRWGFYLGDCVKALNSLADVVHTYYNEGSNMSLNDLGELRQEMDLKNYFVSEAMQPLHMCMPYWGSEVNKAKKESLEEALKDSGGVTAAREVYKAYDPYAKTNKHFETMEECLKMCRETMDKASKISFSLAYKTRGISYFDTSKTEDDDHEFRK